MHKHITPNMIFSVNYYTELRNAITIYILSISFLPNKGQIGGLDTIEHRTSLLGIKNDINREEI